MKNEIWKYEVRKMILSINSFKNIEPLKKTMHISTPSKLDDRTVMFLNRRNNNIILVDETDTICSYNVNVL
jgi:hypothetical protein